MLFLMMVKLCRCVSCRSCSSWLIGVFELFGLCSWGWVKNIWGL